MPKVTWMNSSPPEVTEVDCMKVFSANVKKYLALREMRREVLAFKCGIGASTMGEYLREPVKFRAGVMAQIMDVLEFSDEDRNVFKSY